MVRVLVTGAAGGLGRAWMRRLEVKGATLAPAFPGPVELIGRTRGELDLAAPKGTAEAIDALEPDVVLNCAGRTDLDHCEAFKWDAYRVNRDGADQVARACTRRGALAVYFSTDLVFDGGKLEPYREEDPPNPVNSYGASKLAGELRTASGAKRHLILRTGWLFGQPGRHLLTPVVDPPNPRVPVRLPVQVGLATWVEDFLDAAHFLIREGKTGRWHAASPGPVTPAEVMRRARKLVGGTEDVIGARGPGKVVPLPGFTALDVSKLQTAGHAMRNWEAGLSAYIKTI